MEIMQSNHEKLSGKFKAIFSTKKKKKKKKCSDKTLSIFWEKPIYENFGFSEMNQL